MIRHTPGPWSIGGSTSSRPTLHIHGARSAIASVFSRRLQADANLIKASPTMLAALRQVTALDGRPLADSPSWRADYDRAIRLARLAIDLAEGRG